MNRTSLVLLALLVVPGVASACSDVEDLAVQEGTGGSSTGGAGGSGTPTGGSTAESGGAGNPSGGTAGSGQANGGEAGTGEGGVPANEPGIGVFGEPCSPEGARACKGHAQRQQLQCLSGHWGGDQVCEMGTFCNSAEGDDLGLCLAIPPECVDKNPGDSWCEDKDRIACGLDNVSLVTLDTCYACRPEGCYCPPGTAMSDGTSPVDCIPCATGFASEENAASCTAWKTCSVGQYISTPGTDTANRACTACPAGTTNTSQDSTSCRPEQVAVSDHTCILMNGNVRCWGRGNSGQLGYGNTNTIGDDETAASVGNVNVGGTVAQVAVGGHTCVVLTNGKVRCWGASPYGQLGYGNTNAIGDNEAPNSAGDVDVGGAVAQIAVGDYHTCALLTNGKIRCWGIGDVGILGYGNTNTIGDNETPASVGDVNIGGTVTQIAVGSIHSCALLTTGKVRCWGNGGGGALGYGDLDMFLGDNEAAGSAGDVNLSTTATQIVAGYNHTCALLTGGNVHCWGLDTVGVDALPSAHGDVQLGGTVVKLASGAAHVCALLSNGSVRCWGDGSAGRLGYGNNAAIGDNETPASAGDVSLGGSALQIAAGAASTCAIVSDGLRCWGPGAVGVLGYGNTNAIGDNETPASIGFVPFL